MKEETTNNVLPEETGEKDIAENAGEKLFTREEVNKIVQERLKRSKITQEKAVTADQEERERLLSEREAELQRREREYECRSYLRDRDYPEELMGILDTSDAEAFIKMANDVARVFQNKYIGTAPLYTKEGQDDYADVNSAFMREAKHRPRQYPYGFDD